MKKDSKQLATSKDVLSIGFVSQSTELVWCSFFYRVYFTQQNLRERERQKYIYNDSIQTINSQ